MARKNLTSQALKKKNTLMNVADVSGQFQKELLEKTNVSELPSEVRQQIKHLSDEMLEDDPFNETIYGDDMEVEMLAKSMKEYGFQGIILAYPNNGKYMIESGHRRRLAGRRAGIKEYPVLITETPENEWERKMRLFLGNLHGRREKPMVLARTAQGLYETHEMEIKYKKKHGLIKEGEITALNQLVALDMEVDIKTIEKYRSLLKLIPSLQELADSEKCSWSALTAAVTLNQEQQRMLEEILTKKINEGGSSSVTRPWIVNAINEIKQEQELSESGTRKEEKEQNIRIRRKNGTKVIVKCAKDLHEVLDKDSLIKEMERGSIVEVLEKLKNSIEMKIARLKNEQPNG